MLLLPSDYMREREREREREMLSDLTRFKGEYSSNSHIGFVIPKLIEY